MTKEQKNAISSSANIINTVNSIVDSVGKQLGYELQLNVYDESYSDSMRLEGSYKDTDLLSRTFTIRAQNGRKFEVSNGWHSPSHLESDSIQKIIVGKIAESLLKINWELSV